MGRPPTRPVKLKSGFYIEIKSKGSNSGIKIRRENLQQIEQAIHQYEPYFEVEYLGKLKDGKWIKEEK